LAIDALGRRGLAQSADLDDPPVADADVAEANAVVIDHGPIDQNAIETRLHLGSFLQWRKTGLFDSVRPCKRDRSRLMHKKAAMLEDRGVISVSGEDATSFLQGLLTNDVERLAPSEARYAALLTPQGKILFDMIVVRAPGEQPAYLIDCTAAQGADLAKRLGFYKLRAKVTVADVSADRAVAAFWGADPEPVAEGLIYADPREPRLGWRAILPRPIAAAIGSEHLAEYEGLRISAGAPKGGLDFAYADAFPHDANFDLLHGVDFEKGCYVGQEVVSRMKHRGTARKRVARVKLGGPAVAPGAPFIAG
jgi:tRNA-modifying protein YgfZ